MATMSLLQTRRQRQPTIDSNQSESNATPQLIYRTKPIEEFRSALDELHLCQQIH